jgi:hypothetical protein
MIILLEGEACLSRVGRVSNESYHKDDMSLGEDSKGEGEVAIPPVPSAPKSPSSPLGSILETLQTEPLAC